MNQTKINQNKLKKYTFIYCMLHDDGCVIEGLYDYVPEGYKMQHSDQCESCDWYQMGAIAVTGISIKIIKAIRINYQRYNGGFEFHGYNCCITDKKGNSLKIDEHSDLYKWIDTIAIDNNENYLEPDK